MSVLDHLRRAWIDAHIGWHQGGAERAERVSARHRNRERVWRDRYEAHWPNPFRSAVTKDQP